MSANKEDFLLSSFDRTRPEQIVRIVERACAFQIVMYT